MVNRRHAEGGGLHAPSSDLRASRARPGATKRISAVCVIDSEALKSPSRSTVGRFGGQAAFALLMFVAGGPRTYKRASPYSDIHPDEY